jgi:hypothetical protein
MSWGIVTEVLRILADGRFVNTAVLNISLKKIMFFTLWIMYDRRRKVKAHTCTEVISTFEALRRNFIKNQNRFGIGIIWGFRRS